jgi:hypothetical protein
MKLGTLNASCRACISLVRVTDREAIRYPTRLRFASFYPYTGRYMIPSNRLLAIDDLAVGLLLLKISKVLFCSKLPKIVVPDILRNFKFLLTCPGEPHPHKGIEILNIDIRQRELIRGLMHCEEAGCITNETIV